MGKRKVRDSKDGRQSSSRHKGMMVPLTTKVPRQEGKKVIDEASVYVRTRENEGEL